MIMGFSSWLPCCFNRHSPDSANVRVDVKVNDRGSHIAVLFEVEGCAILVMNFETALAAHHWAFRVDGAREASVAFPEGIDASTFAQASRAARVQWVAQGYTWEVSQGDFLTAVCSAFDSSAKRALLVVGRWRTEPEKTSRGVAKLADDGSAVVSKTSHSNSFALSASSTMPSPRSSVDESPDDSEWDVNLLLQGFVPREGSQCGVSEGSEWGGAGWPQEVVISPCSVSTEVLEWPSSRAQC